MVYAGMVKGTVKGVGTNLFAYLSSTYTCGGTHCPSKGGPLLGRRGLPLHHGGWGLRRQLQGKGLVKYRNKVGSNPDEQCINMFINKNYQILCVCFIISRHEEKVLEKTLFQV